jgi:thiamine biosynthesis lipoprotein
VAAHGFHGSEPDMDAIAEIKRDIPGMQDLSVEANIAVSSNPHLQIDLGGIAKGYALDLLGDYLDKNGIDHYIINAGGDMVTSGNRFGRPWRIGIQNPFAPGVVASLEIEGKQSLFTSGNYHRRYWRGEDLAHHIIDPRNGEASSGQSSATVLSSDPVLADVAATALMIDGLRSYHGLASSLQIEDYLLISEQREIIMSRSMANKIEITAPWPISIVD